MISELILMLYMLQTPAQKKASAAAALAAAQAASIPPAPVLKISRNKHMKVC